MRGFDLDAPVLDQYNEISSALTRIIKMAKDIESYTSNEIKDATLKALDVISATRGLGLKNSRETLEIISSIATGGSRSKTSLVLKDLLDPYKKTYAKEYYDDVIVSLLKDDTEGTENLVSELPKIGIKTDSLITKIASEYGNGEITKEEAMRLVPILPTLKVEKKEVDYGDKLQDKLNDMPDVEKLLKGGIDLPKLQKARTNITIDKLTSTSEREELLKAKGFTSEEIKIIMDVVY
jgi:hypothetical protein